MRTRSALLAAAFVAVLAPPALAYQCEAFIELLDQKMAEQELSQEQKAELRRLRDEGQRLHEQGQHEASMEVLERAEMMLVPGAGQP
jgi:competence protein ComGC